MIGELGAAALLQAGAHGMAARGAIGRQRREGTKEATARLQAGVRGRATRGGTGQRRQMAALRIQAEDAAAMRIQASIGGRTTRTHVEQRLREDEAEAALQIQAGMAAKAVKGGVWQQRQNTEAEAASHIQALVRGRSTRRDVEDLYNKIAAMEICAREAELILLQEISLQALKQNSIARVQAGMAGRASRCRVRGKRQEADTAAATCIHAAMEGMTARGDAHQRQQEGDAEAAARIQAAMEGRAARGDAHQRQQEGDAEAAACIRAAMEGKSPRGDLLSGQVRPKPIVAQAALNGMKARNDTAVQPETVVMGGKLHVQAGLKAHAASKDEQGCLLTVRESLRIEAVKQAALRLQAFLEGKTARGGMRRSLPKPASNCTPTLNLC